MEILFVTSFCVLFYIFLGYPAVLWLMHKTINTQIKHSESQDVRKDITVIICIHNGKDKLCARIENILNNGYPEDLIKIIVVSDGSVDHPETVLENYDEKTVSLIHYSENRGKSHALNVGINAAETDILVFTDIRQRFKENTIQLLVNEVSKENIAAVSGNLVIQKDGSSVEEDPGLYWKYEKWIRKMQSHTSTLLGVTGAVYAAKKALIPILPKNTILDDMYVPMHMNKHGYSVKFVESAVAYDSSSSSLKEEFFRKVRTLAGNFQLMSLHPWILNPLKNPVFMHFFSHKILRLVMPYCLIVMIISSLMSKNEFLNTLGYAQLIFYIYSCICYEALRRGKKLPLNSVLVSFCSLNVASFVSGWKYFFSPVESLWKKH